jgi:hypothetical protein
LKLLITDGKMDKRKHLKELYEKFYKSPTPRSTGGNAELSKLFGQFVEWKTFVMGLVNFFVYHNKLKTRDIYAHAGMGKALDGIVPKTPEEAAALNEFREYNKKLTEMLTLLKEIIAEERL